MGRRLPEALFCATVLRRDKRPGQSPLRLILERLLMAPHEDSADDDADCGRDKKGHADRPRISLDGAAEPKGSGAEDRSPRRSHRRR